MRQELLINASINDTIVKYAQNTRAAGLDGVVCSPLEAGMVHEACGKEFLTVTPGVRLQTETLRTKCASRPPVRGRSAPTSSSWPSDHRRSGPRGRVPQVRKRILR